MFNFTFSGFIISMLVSGVGYVFFKYGRRMGRSPFVSIGIIIMVFPYFITETSLMIEITAGLCVILFLMVKKGL